MSSRRARAKHSNCIPEGLLQLMRLDVVRMIAQERLVSHLAEHASWETLVATGEVTPMFFCRCGVGEITGRVVAVTSSVSTPIQFFVWHHAKFVPPTRVYDLFKPEGNKGRSIVERCVAVKVAGITGTATCCTLEKILEWLGEDHTRRVAVIVSDSVFWQSLSFADLGSPLPAKTGEPATSRKRKGRTPELRASQHDVSPTLADWDYDCPSVKRPRTDIEIPSWDWDIPLPPLFDVDIDALLTSET